MCVLTGMVSCNWCEGTIQVVNGVRSTSEKSFESVDSIPVQPGHCPWRNQQQRKIQVGEC